MERKRQTNMKGGTSEQAKGGYELGKSTPQLLPDQKERVG